ncbi:Oidioi.mRNA.OKI2018_I69.PAR.g9464.t1.cds [Oikopleura dioica]|uniref:Oidioi.mRNA.OKI2018_I69.PAR.g9464.t1.cds n=1 Tax=Oikopleura dioica TaxID=34765 RepID=A0ABN7RPU3_OIKDI|nr:Oidioi.mRNA.OKI2018_I69.PAR.g9464.t1.cds [Oikopleura dioica]
MKFLFKVIFFLSLQSSSADPHSPAILNDELNEHCHQIPNHQSMKCFFSEDEKFSLFCSCGESVCDETWEKTWKHNSQEVQVDEDDITRRLTLKGGSAKNGYSELDIFMKHSLQGNFTCFSKSDSSSEVSIMEYHIAVPHLDDKFQIDARIRSPYSEDALFTTKVGKEIELECKAPLGEPEPEISWYRNDKAIDNHRPRKVQGKSILTIRSVKLEDTGLYGCEARARVGSQLFSKFSERVKILVESKPKIFDLLICPEKRVNSRASLSCEFRGEPLPEIYWEKCESDEKKSDPQRNEQGCKKWEGPNNTHVNENERTVRSTINFRKIKLSDSGVYRCWAINHLGETPSQCVQTVYENIEVVKPLSQTKYEGADASFSCGGAGAKVISWEFYPKNEDPKIVAFSKRERVKDGVAKIYFEAQSLSDRARRNDRLTANWIWTRSNSLNKLEIKRINEQNAGKYLCTVVYDGPNEENEHLLEATLTVPSQYEIRGANVQKYVGISLDKDSVCNVHLCGVTCSGVNAKSIQWKSPHESEITEKEVEKMITHSESRNSESETFSRINFGSLGPDNIQKVLGRWECVLIPRKPGKANVITKQVDVLLKSNETMQRDLMNIKLQDLNVDELISFRPSFCPDNCVFLIVYGGDKSTRILDTLYCKKFLKSSKIDPKISHQIAIIPAFEEHTPRGELQFITSRGIIRKKQIQSQQLAEENGIFASTILLIKPTASNDFQRITAKKLQLNFHDTNTSLLISWEEPDILEMGRYYITKFLIEINLPQLSEKNGIIEEEILSGKKKIAVNLSKYYSHEDLRQVKEVHVRLRVVSRIYQSEAISKSLNILILEEPEKSQLSIGLFIVAMLVAILAIGTAICTCLCFLRRKKEDSKRESESLEIPPPEKGDQRDSHAARIQKQILEDQDFNQKRPRKRGRKRLARPAEDDPYEGEDELDEPQAKFVLPQMDPSRNSTYSDQFTVSDHDDDDCYRSGRYGNRPVGIVPPYTPPRAASQLQYIPSYNRDDGQKSIRYQADNF